MIGAIILIVAMLLFIPVLLGGGMAVAALLGWLLKSDAEQRYEGSEYIKLGR